MIKLLALFLGTLTIAGAQAPVGKFTVDGKAVQLTQVYAYATEGFFDKKKDDTVVLLTDRPVTEAQMRDGFALRRLTGEGKLVFVQETINAAGQIVSFLMGHSAFKALPSGGSTDHVFEGRMEGGTVSGTVRTTSGQEFFGTKYEYNVKFQATIQ
ncbi:MAG: hypothetical protein ABI824_11125, partial [Acidobacteriota bacterium]